MNVISQQRLIVSRSKIRGLGIDAEDDAAALEVGIEEAQNLARVIRKSARGLYLMPPFGSAEIAKRVMEAL